jgi:hypothetical protein
LFASLRYAALMAPPVSFHPAKTPNMPAFNALQKLGSGWGVYACDPFEAL